MKNLKKILKPIYRKIIKILPTKLVLNIENFRGYHKFVDFKNPKYFGEKIQWLKLNGNLERYNDYVDKYLVREFIKKEIGEEYLIPLLGVYDSPEEIDYDKLPDSFVLKLNTGSGYNIIVTDKSKLDINRTNKQLRKWLKEDYAKMKKEPQYKNIKKKILCEAYMSDRNGELLDYKFFCFNGKPEFLKVDFDRYLDHKVNFYDTNWKKIDMKEGKEWKNTDRDIPKPKNFEKMLSIVTKLCSNFNFIRVDLYNIDDEIYFGELTLTPAAGVNPFYPLEKDLEIASLIKLPERVLYIGSLGRKNNRLDGVTVKARILEECLNENDFILNVVDVDNYKKHPFKVGFEVIKNYKKSDEIVICSSSYGASILLRFLAFIKNKKNIYYFVSGGNLGSNLSKKKYNLSWYKNIKEIYVESEKMLKEFQKLGLSQTRHINNFRKPLIDVEVSKVDYQNVKFVFYGRVVKEKGIEEAIKLIKKLTDEEYKVSLDIYGQCKDDYIHVLKEKIGNYKNINYKGVIKPDKKIEYKILSQYDVFIFPTEHDGEGLPGALIDSYISGLSIIASNWSYAKEYIDEGRNGYIFEYKNYDDMYNKTVKMINERKIDSFKKHSKELSEKFIADKILVKFITNLQGEKTR